MDELEEIKATFFQECDELLGDLEAGLLRMEAGEGDSETVNAVFRAVHSVKGGAGAFALDELVRYAHVFETLLDGVRSGKIEAAPELVRVLLRAADVLADEVLAARTGGRADEHETANMVAELEAWIAGEPLGGEPAGASAAAPPPTPPRAPPPVEDDLGFDFKPMAVVIPDVAPLEPVAAKSGWTIVFKPDAALYAKANEAGLLLRELGRLGPIEVELDESALPSLDALDPDGAYLSWTVKLDADVEEQAIREVFEFVDGDCELTITRAASGGDEPDLAALIAAASAPPPIEAAPVAAPPPVMATPIPVAPIEPPPVEAAPIEAHPAAAEEAHHPAAEGGRGEAPAARSGAPRPGGEPPAAQATIRVDPERIDRLIDLVGELVINQAMLAQRVVQHGFAPSSDIAMGLDELEQLTRGIQDSVMAIRAQPVKSVFQRMPRLAREVAAQIGKHVRLVMEGEGTEVDKTVIERLAEPITHMLRNAIDHGLETPEERIAAGKPIEGQVRLAALHRGGRIVIEVQDDGRGINRARVRQIAVDKGLLAPDAVLSDEEVDNLIFLPGFSTATAVSDISGRGVGMDVVRRSVQALGGRISISSRPGEGSTFTLSLPLTLAVLDGMVVDVAGHTLVVPLTSIIESLRPKPEEVRPLGPQGAVLAVRDSYVPLVDVGSVLGFRKASIPPTEGVVLLVEHEDGGRAALVADVIQGQRQVVIKSLEANYRQVEGIAAATILGDGRVALILDVDAVVAMRRRDPRPGEARSTETTLHAAE
jgi:two-component system, chemotaxis family, sensor kinase CheA